MKINFGTLAFGYIVEAGGSNPNWGTALGQGKGYKINNTSEINELIKGMIFSAIPTYKVGLAIGKGGKFILGVNEDSPIVIAAAFSKVYVNDILITGEKFILIITRDTSVSHYGRLKLKYGKSNQYKDDNHTYTNENFFARVREQLNLNKNACWFVSEINIEEQDTIKLKAVIVNRNGQETYKTVEEMHAVWSKLDENIADYHGEEKCARKLSFPFNRILYGAPGTGKSYQLTQDLGDVFTKSKYCRRVTFHPAYTYAQFFGSYKPISKNGNIEYQYVAGPFLKTIIDAKSDPGHSYVIIIEEINRANVAAVFGDAFQLLDRDKNGNSEYDITISGEILEYIKNFNDEHKERQNVYVNDYKLGIPSNMYIWATMNSADQGVMPLDTAFKRRWNMEYISIDENADKLSAYKYKIELKYDLSQQVKWNDIRKNINKLLLNANINEDKCLGPFFISKAALDMAVDDNTIFFDVFKNKVLMYLYEDAAKYEISDIFKHEYKSLSDLFDDFFKLGMNVFNFEKPIENIATEKYENDNDKGDNS